MEQALRFGQRQPLEFLGDLADHRHPHANEHVALAVLPRPGLEESGQESGVFWIPQ